MAQLSERGRRKIPGEKSSAASAGAWAKHLVAAIVGVLVMATATVAHADGAPSAEEKASCMARLEPVEKAIEHDYKYARAWTDSWIVASTSLVILNTTQAFLYDDYKRWVNLTFAAASVVLQLQRPLALTSGDSLKQIRTASIQDPCLALADASHVMKSNQVDGELHRGWPIHVINVAANVALVTVLALATGHFDFLGDSNMGAQGLAGIALSELAIFTYPSGTFRAAGTSVEVSF